jgi:hypothetical protein
MPVINRIADFHDAVLPLGASARLVERVPEADA